MIISKIKNLFCTHDFAAILCNFAVNDSKNNTRLIKCKKCGKIKRINL